MTTPQIDATQGPFIEEIGRKMVKLPNPVFMVEIEDAEGVDVETAEGIMHGNQGDVLCYDPISGHVWPVTADYVDQHYTAFTEPADDPDGTLQALQEITVPEGAPQAAAHVAAAIEEVKSYQANQALADQPVAETDPVEADTVPDPTTDTGTNQPVNQNLSATADKATTEGSTNA